MSPCGPTSGLITAWPSRSFASSEQSRAVRKASQQRTVRLPMLIIFDKLLESKCCWNVLLRCPLAALSIVQSNSQKLKPRRKNTEEVFFEEKAFYSKHLQISNQEIRPFFWVTYCTLKNKVSNSFSKQIIVFRILDTFGMI